MVLVDSSVWIDYFDGAATPQTDELDRLLGRDVVLLGDLVLTEVLQGFRDVADYRLAKELLAPLEFRPLVGREVALLAAESYRILRAQDHRHDHRQLLPDARYSVAPLGP